MNDDLSYRLIFGLLMVISLPAPVYFRLQSCRVGGPVSRRGEGAGIMVPLRLCGALGGVTILAWLLRPAWVNWARLDLPDGFRWLGIGLWVAIIPFQTWVYQTLGLNMTDTVAVRERHELVRRGPYRLMRHPMYLTFTTIFTATSLVTANGFLAVCFLGALALLHLRTPLEEAALIERYGETYREYIRTTGSYWPRLSRSGRAH